MRLFDCLLLLILLVFGGGTFSSWHPFLLLLPVSAATITDPTSGCKDDGKFRFLNDLGMTKKCVWIRGKEKRRNRYCHRRPIGQRCPVSCGMCTTSTNSNKKNIADTQIPPVDISSCQDSDDFHWKNQEKKNCNWIGNHADRREKLCQNENVSRACPKSCKVCCADDESFQFSTTYHGSRKNCHWLTLNPWRQHQFCSQNYNGALIETKCPLSCGLCGDTERTNNAMTGKQMAMPSISPTASEVVNHGNDDEVEVDDAKIPPTIISPTSTSTPSVPTTTSPSPAPTKLRQDKDLTMECKVDITLFTSFDYLVVKNIASGEICSSSSQFCDFLSSYTHDVVSIHDASSRTFDVRIVSEEDGITTGNLTLDINGVTRIRESWNHNEEIPVLRMVCSKDCSCSFMKLFF